MPRTDVDGVSIAYEVIGEGRPWIVTPGGRFSKDYPGVRELAVALAEHGNRVLIWDRPNCGESEVCFRGDSESEMQADILAGLLRARGAGSVERRPGSGDVDPELRRDLHAPSTESRTLVGPGSAGVHRHHG